jgi:hypothetical protein
MSRVTAPAHKLTRTITSSAVSTQNAGAVLMPKYAELLRNRRTAEHQDSSRGLATSHRPTPQPSIANRTKPLMQTFHSSAAAAAPVSHLDSTRLPSLGAEAPGAVDFGIRVPLMPDNYSAQHGPLAADAPVSMPSIVAADPSNVIAGNALSEIEGISLDGVELKFAHEAQPAEARESGMLADIFRGMVDDVFGQASKRSA